MGGPSDSEVEKASSRRASRDERRCERKRLSWRTENEADHEGERGVGGRENRQQIKAR